MKTENPNADRTYTPAELELMLRGMTQVNHAFYVAAVQIGFHSYIEFAGLLNEFVGLCAAAAKNGQDFTMTSVHSGQSLPMEFHHAAYLGEKLGCIYGNSIKDENATALFGAMGLDLVPLSEPDATDKKLLQRALALLEQGLFTDENTAKSRGAVVEAIKKRLEPAKPNPPFHALFQDRKLDANVDYRQSYIRGDLEKIVNAVEADMKERQLDLDTYVGASKPGYGSGSNVLGWYADVELPEDRTGLIAMLHPQYHRRGWVGFFDTIEKTAKELNRWVWVVESGHSHWYLAMVGDEPRDGEGDDLGNPWNKHVRVDDQLIAVMSPAGDWKILGVS